MIREHPSYKLLGDLGQDRGRGDWRTERDGASDRSEVCETNADGHGPPGPEARPQPGGNPVGKMTQRRSEHSLVGWFPAECRLRAGRSRPAMRRDLPWIAIPRQCRQLVSGRATEQLLERPTR